MLVTQPSSIGLHTLVFGLSATAKTLSRLQLMLGPTS
jgi:hypothetical protein